MILIQVAHGYDSFLARMQADRPAILASAARPSRPKAAGRVCVTSAPRTTPERPERSIERHHQKSPRCERRLSDELRGGSHDSPLTLRHRRKRTPRSSRSSSMSRTSDPSVVACWARARPEIADHQAVINGSGRGGGRGPRLSAERVHDRPGRLGVLHLPRLAAVYGLPAEGIDRPMVLDPAADLITASSRSLSGPGLSGCPRASAGLACSALVCSLALISPCRLFIGKLALGCCASWGRHGASIGPRSACSTPPWSRGCCASPFCAPCCHGRRPHSRPTPPRLHAWVRP
jgi:hypothetical protein